MSILEEARTAINGDYKIKGMVCTASSIGLILELLIKKNIFDSDDVKWLEEKTDPLQNALLDYSIGLAFHNNTAPIPPEMITAKDSEEIKQAFAEAEKTIKGILTKSAIAKQIIAGNGGGDGE